MRTFPSKENLLFGHTSEATAYVVEDYPYGFKLRCKIRYWIETDPRRGDRFCSQTTNPKITTREFWNNPKKSTYASGTMMFLYLDEKGHVSYSSIYNEATADKSQQEMKDIIDFLVNVYGLENISAAQQHLIRMSYVLRFRYSYPYVAPKYTDAKRPEFEQWTKDVMAYASKCDFKAIADHAAPPEQDNPDGAMKWKTTTYSVGENGISEKVVTVEG